MFGVTREAVPESSLLATYRGGRHPERWGEYLDCFVTTVPGSVALADYVSAFYTTWPFRLERAILRLALGAASTDADARAVGAGTATTFAVWNVGARTSTQLLMCDRFERTRSWFEVESRSDGSTTLRFGSGVVSETDPESGKPAMRRGFRWLLGFHALYSQLLLAAARAQCSPA
jgi:hypothetical protein